jgi:two-component system sensor histidine kinase KdpD
MNDNNPSNRRPDPDALLQELQLRQKQESRGKLKIYFGYAAGTGKTYAMLDDARSKHAAGADIVIGYLEPHTRPETMRMAEGLETIPPREIAYREITLREFDLDAALKRRPKVLLVDELAHTNVEGLRHKKRWQDIEELLDAGIDVHTTVNVQHIESLNDIVASITQVIVRETVPDQIFDSANQVELIDIEPVELLRRLKEGKVYVSNQAALATQNFFTEKNLIALREIAMRRSADRIFKINRLQRQGSREEAWATLGETLLVCLSPSPTNGHVIRAASRIAEAFHAQWIALYIETPQRSQLEDDERKRLKDNMDLAERLGARIVQVQGEDIADQIVSYARVQNVSRIVIGKNHRDVGYHRRLFSVDIADKIIAASPYIDVYVIPEQSPRQKKKHVRFIHLNWRFSWRDMVKMLAVLVLVTLVGLLFKQWNFTEANIIILYLMGVLIVSSQTRGHLPGVLCSVFSVVTFNFFFTEPYYTFIASGPYYPLTFAVMFGAAILTSTLTSRIRGQASVSASREKTNDILLQTSRILMRSHDRGSLGQAISDHLVRLFERSVVCYIPATTNTKELPEPSLGAYNASPNAVHLLSKEERAVAAWVYENSREAGRGTNTLPGSSGFYIPVISENRAIAVLGLLCENERVVPLEQRKMLWTVAGQIALAIEREQLHESHEQTQKEIEREQLRSNLLRAVSHDLRTPLTGIYGAANTALENDDVIDAKTRKQLLKSICEDADWLIQIVENLLSVTRIDDGRLKLNLKEEVIEEIISESIERIEKHLRNHKLVTNIEQSSALVMMDGKLIEQVLINLIDNAIRYTQEDSTIEINAWCTKQKAYFEVRDNGKGLDKNEIPYLFDRFFTKGEAGPDSRRGIGLGLSIAKSIVTAHGGEIIAFSRVPNGAVFRFVLPLQPPKEENNT